MRPTLRIFNHCLTTSSFIFPPSKKMSNFITKKQNFRRMKKAKVMEEGDLDSADVLTYRRYAVPQDDGTSIIKNVLETLDSSPLPSTSQYMQIDPQQPHHDDLNIDDMSRPQTPMPRRCRVCAGILKSLNTYIAFLSDAKRLSFGVCFTYRCSFGCIPNSRGTCR